MFVKSVVRDAQFGIENAKNSNCLFLAEKENLFPYLDEKGLSQVVFHEPYILLVEYLGSEIQEVPYKTMFSSNIFYKFYIEMASNRNVWHELDPVHISDTSFRQMQSRLSTNLTIDLSDVEVGLGELFSV